MVALKLGRRMSGSGRSRRASSGWLSKRLSSLRRASSFTLQSLIASPSKEKVAKLVRVGDGELAILQVRTVRVRLPPSLTRTLSTSRVLSPSAMRTLWQANQKSGASDHTCYAATSLLREASVRAASTHRASSATVPAAPAPPCLPALYSGPAADRGSSCAATGRGRSPHRAGR